MKQMYANHINSNPKLKGRLDTLFKSLDGTILTEDQKRPLKKLRKNDLRYSGNVYLLTGSYTFSSAVSFAWAFQQFDMGTIIGEETGGLVVSFGDVIYLHLPNTKLKYGVSHKKFYGYGATDANRHGVIPDIKVPAREAMDRAFEIIRQKK